MTEYLEYTFNDNQEFINTFDELPLWSASFGLLLLKHLELKPNLTVLDIGSGTGFPLLELAGRLGNSCTLYGIDPWINANNRARQKIKNYDLSNVQIIENSAEDIPLEDNSVDIIVSNLGLHNFSHPQLVLKECNRVIKPNGKIALTTNLNGHWKEFYSVFEATLLQLGKTGIVRKLTEHQEHRGTIESISMMFTECGFRVCRQFEDSFEMKFLDGSAFLNHNFVKIGWLSSWKELLGQDEVQEIFLALEQNLNVYAKKMGGLTLTVPMAYIEGEKENSQNKKPC
jgi:ubiquinone/menaquinone biosynthesis C-methylase UbiE